MSGIRRKTPEVDTVSEMPGEIDRRRYSSASMAERRDRLVKVTLAQMKKGRANELNLRDLARQAGVSLSVLYANFGSKEGLVAAAVEAFYRRQVASQRPAPPTIEGMLEQIGEDAKVTMANPNYVRSLCDLYFRHHGGKLVFTEMNMIARDTFRPWLEAVVEKGELRPGVTRHMAEAILAGDRWHAISEWVRGHTPTAQFPEATRLRFLVTAAGLTAGETHEALARAIPPCARRLAALEDGEQPT